MELAIVDASNEEFLYLIFCLTAESTNCMCILYCIMYMCIFTRKDPQPTNSTNYKTLGIQKGYKRYTGMNFCNLLFPVFRLPPTRADVCLGLSVVHISSVDPLSKVS
jgi:hypothetical protein